MAVVSRLDSQMGKISTSKSRGRMMVRLKLTAREVVWK